MTKRVRKTWVTLGALAFAAVALSAIVCACAGQSESSGQEDSGAVQYIYDNRLDELIADGATLSEDEKQALCDAGATYANDHHEYLQYGEVESGCEIASLAAALASYGFNVTASEIADNYLEIDGDHEFGYLASPYTDYGGGFPPGIAKAANKYLKAQSSELAAHTLSGSTFNSLRALIEAGYPVLVWTTLDLSPPNYDPELGGTDTWYVNEHCVVLYGASDKTVLVSDPLQGLVEHDAGEFADIYEQCGSYALAIW